MASEAPRHLLVVAVWSDEGPAWVRVCLVHCWGVGIWAPPQRVTGVDLQPSRAQGSPQSLPHSSPGTQALPA